MQLTDGDVIRLVNTAFGYCYKEAKLSTKGASDIEHNKHCGQVSTNMRLLTSKEGDVLSHFEKIDKSESQIRKTSPKHQLNNNHDVAVILKSEIKGK